jgi:hypothetical protein
MKFFSAAFAAVVMIKLHGRLNSLTKEKASLVIFLLPALYSAHEVLERTQVKV